MTPALINHLWQSTVVAMGAALVALALRRNQASTRHAVWLAASLKFLVPFSLLIALGVSFAWRAAPAPTAVAPTIAETVQTIAEPFADVSTPARAIVPPTPTSMPWATLLAAVWFSGVLVVMVLRVRGWLSVRAALRASTPMALASVDNGVDVRAAPGLLEPGVVGIWRPVLLVPVGLDRTLNSDQLRAVVAHELHHIQRRDNLTSALHMAVEAVFWFHPIVWWLGARLIDERERACDEYVVASGAAPDAYAEAILNVCKRYVEQPVAFVSGVTGSDLKKRVGAILANRVGARLSLPKTIALGLAATAALAAPLVVGVLTAPMRVAAQASGPLPKFDVVSVKPCDPNNLNGRGSRGQGAGAAVSPGRLTENCLTLLNLMQNAYVRFADGRGHDAWRIRDTPIEGGPEWIKHDPFLIEVTADASTPQEMMRGPMLQAVLEDRFHLKVHRETRQGPIYELIVAAGGSKLTPAKPGMCVPPDWTVFPAPTLPDGQHYCGITGGPVDEHGNKLTPPLTGSTHIFAWEDEAISLDDLASDLLHLDRPVVNKTGISGLVTLHLTHRFDPTDPQDGSPVTDAHIAAIELKEQLGLELKPSTGPRDSLVIDHVERPVPNDAILQPAPQTFDVVSIRPCESTPGVPGGRNGGGGPVFSPGLFVYNCGTLEQLINGAYVANGDPLLNDEGRVAVASGGVRDAKTFPERIRGGPDWVRTERFMIEAKTSLSTGASGRGAVPERAMLMGPMLRALLEDRFKLKLQRDIESNIPMYALTVAKSGLKLKPVGPDGGCTPSDPNRSEPYHMDEEIAAVRNGGKPICGHGIMGGDVGPNHALVLNGQTMAGVARWLSGVMDRHVLDRTGVGDKFVIYVEYAPDDAVPYDFRTLHESTDPPTAPTIAQALKALGLELQPVKGPKGFIVIDHAERPSMAEPAIASMRARGSGR